MTGRVVTSCAAALVLMGLCVLAFAQSLTFPALTGRVVDDAGILDASVKSDLDSKLAALEDKTANQLVVVTLKSLQGTSIEDYGYQLGRKWQIGQKDKNNGALLIVAPKERKVRIEVGYGLEGPLTDAVAKLIIENSVLPRFRANDYPGGIMRGTDDIIAVLSGDAEEYQKRAAQRPDSAFSSVDFGNVVLLIIVFIVIISLMSRARRSGPWNGGGPVFFPTGSSSSGSSWGSGSSGGGFSGSGGSFGGGGSSGSW